MTETVNKKLVFRISGVGFALSLESLIEIREDGAAELDTSAADPELDLLGLVGFRDEAIYAIDVRRRLGLPASAGGDDIFLVVTGENGRWALPVESVEGIFPASEFSRKELPPLLAAMTQRAYESLDVWKSEPLINCEPLALEAYRGAA